MSKIYASVQRALTYKSCKNAGNNILAWKKRAAMLVHYKLGWQEADVRFCLNRLQYLKRIMKCAIMQTCSMKNAHFFRQQRCLSNAVRFWHVYTAQIKRFCLVRMMMKFHYSFKRLLLQTQRTMIQRVQKVRAQFRFEYVACRKTFRKLGRYTRTYLHTIIHMLIHLFK